MMNCEIKYNVAKQGRTLIKLACLGFLLLGASIAQAESITGSMEITGNYTLTGDTLTLNTVIGASNNGTGDLGSTVVFGTIGTPGAGSTFLITSNSTVPDVFQIGGWQLDLTSSSVTDNTNAPLLTLGGTGILSSTDISSTFDNTVSNWTLSLQGQSSYSMSVSAIPVPAAVWLFGSGLIGLIGVARRRPA